VVFCRNVLPTFDSTTKLRVLTSIAQIMVPEGKLFLSNGETIHGIGDRFKPANDAYDYYIA
jgi:chemotaxis methyl-accepting protein methylase